MFGHRYHGAARPGSGTPVDGDALLDSITQAVCRYLVLPPDGAETVALWAIAAHAFNCFQISPRLHVRSPLPRCGKTIALDVLECLTPRSIRTENVTTAVLFRLVDGYQPTLLIDEVEARLDAGRELCRRAILKYIDGDLVAAYEERLTSTREEVRQEVVRLIEEGYLA